MDLHRQFIPFSVTDKVRHWHFENFLPPSQWRWREERNFRSCRASLFSLALCQVSDSRQQFIQKGMQCPKNTSAVFRRKFKLALSRKVAFCDFTRQSLCRHGSLRDLCLYREWTWTSSCNALVVWKTRTSGYFTIHYRLNTELTSLVSAVISNCSNSRMHCLPEGNIPALLRR